MTRRLFWTQLLGALPALRASGDPASRLTAKQALDRLLEGNRRFRETHPLHPDEEPERRHSVAMGQHPFATILSCSDSRVPPEVIFDQGLGDLFVIRVAGNIVDDAVLGSIEYAAEHLDVPLILVLGHEKCGAVTAALESNHPAAHLRALVKAIHPAVVHSKSKPGDALENAVRENISMVVSQLRRSKPVLERLCSARKVVVQGARYDLDTGMVELIA